MATGKSAAKMTSGERTLRWIEAGGDLCNPILVKETRQALKSRQFVATFMLLLAAAWLVSTFFMLWAGDTIEYSSVAMQFFFAYYVVLAFAVFVIVPFGAYRSLLNENDLNTFDLLNITTLTPRQIVGGKLWTAIVQIFIYYSAIAPFMAFTALLNGFDFASFAFLLVVSNLVAIALSMVALTLSAFARKKHWQALTSLGLFGGLIWLFFGFLAIAGELMYFRAPFSEPEFWWLIAGLAALVSSYMLLCQQITTAQLTFESDNRSSGVRVVACGQLWVYALALITYLPLSGIRIRREEVFVMSMLPLLHLSLVGFFISTEADALSRRVRRGLPRRGWLRLLYAPFMPGGARGYLYFATQVVLLWIVSWQCFEHVRGGRVGSDVELLAGVTMPDPLPVLTVFCCYAVILVGIGCLLARWGQTLSSEIRAVHARVLTVLVFAAGMVIPFLPRLMRWVSWRDYSVIDVTNMFLTIQEIGRGGARAGVALMLVIGLAGLVLLLNLRAMLLGTLDIVRSVVAPVRHRAGDVPAYAPGQDVLTDASAIPVNPAADGVG